MQNNTKILLESLNNDIIKYLLNEEISSKYSTDVESDVDDLEEQLAGKGILKVSQTESHNIDGTTVSFNFVVVVGSLEYTVNFNNGEATPFISMGGGQNLIPLSAELLDVFAVLINYFSTWKDKWSSIVSSKN